ncbi:hypothetical protein FACS1894199_08690 [Bacteroidia bacterium]|nr:hypothetical protein FACS1894199_08690 [Bacteroidia bacterium]
MGIVIRQSIKGTIVTYVGTFIGFLTTMFVLTQFLSPEDIGLTKVVVEIGTVFGSLALLGVQNSAFRFFPYFRNAQNNHNGFLFYILVIPLVGCILFILLYILLKTPIATYFSQQSALVVSYYYWIIPLIIFTCYLVVLETYSNINMRITVLRLNREVILKLLMLAVYLCYGTHLINRDGLVAGTVCVYGLSMLILFVYIAKMGKISLQHDISFVSKPLRKEILKYSLFLIVCSLSGVILLKLDLFMLTAENGLSDAGIFTIAMYIATVIEIPSRSISAISSPIAANALKEGDLQTSNRLYQKVALHQLLVGGLIFIVVWSNIDNIFAIIPRGDVYAQGKWVVFFIGIAKLILITLSFGNVLLSFSRFYYWSLYLMFFLTVVGILTNLWLIPRFGMTGAAMATALTVLISSSFQQWVVLFKIKGNPYTRGMLKLLLIFTLLIGINYLLYKFENPWLDGISRTVVIVAVGGGLLYVLKVSEELTNTVKVIFRKVILFIPNKGVPLRKNVSEPRFSQDSQD